MAKKEVNAPPELLAAVDAALDSKMTVRQATEVFKYLMCTRGLDRNGGNPSVAGPKLGMTRQALTQSVALLESRLA
jgi:hypothetical protein